MTTNESSTNSSAQSAARNFQAGDKLAGCYTLKQILPFEGVGVVWLAHDEELDKDLTLHFLPDSVVADSAAMEEIRQAAKRNRQLIHPRIMRVHDLIEENNWAAVSMDYAEGETVAALKSKKENGAFNPSEISRWMSELCLTVEDAHRVDLLHRDLAPENLLVSKSGGIIVMNFGISRVVLDSLTRSGQKVHGDGNLAYMSPQQLDGERPNKSDDVYSLGTVAYDLLTGKPPFSEGELVSQIRQNTPPLISERRAELKIDGEPIPKSWDQTIAACLAKQIEERPKSAAEVGAKLGAEKLAPSVAAPVAVAAKPQSESAKTVSAKSETAATEPAHSDTSEAAAAVAGIAAAESAEQTSVKQPSKQRGPEKTPVIAEATILSQTPVAKSSETENVAESGATEEDLETEKQPAGERKPGPTTPSGFPLRAFVGVDRDAEEAKKKSKFPLAWVAIAAVLIAIGIAGYFVNSGSEKLEQKDTNFEPGVKSDENQLRTAQNEITPPRETRPASTPVNSIPAAVVLAANTKQATPTPTAAAHAASPAPSAMAVAVTQPSVSPNRNQTSMTAGGTGDNNSKASQSVAEKIRAAEQARQSLAALQKTQEEQAKAQQQAEAAAKEAQDTLKQKSAATIDAKKSSDQAAAQIKQRTEAQQKAEAEAQQAQKIAEEKTRAAADARKALDEANAAIQKQQTSQQQTDAEIKNLQATVEQRQRAAADAAKAAAETATKLQTQTQVVKQAETEVAQAQAAVEQAAAAEKRRLAEQDIEKKQAEFAKRQADLEAQMRATQEAAARQLDDIRKQAEALQKQRESLRSGSENGPQPPLPASSPSAGVISGTTSVAMLTNPAAQPGVSPKNAGSITVHPPGSVRGRVDQTMQNSLGMKFASVDDVLISVWLTRVQDFEAFARATSLKSADWRRPGFQQGADHPVVKVSWNDAMAFCKWLTERERKEGLLAANESYRLPTDVEWSKAVGLPDEPGRTPESRDMDIPDQYPWGADWPPPQGAGNFTGEETDSDVAIKGYNDGYAWTSPVGSFAPNKAGLYDMGGNVRQWCMDWWNNEQHDKVLRGSSWYNGALKLSLLSSCRNHAQPTSVQDTDGFRVVIVTNEPAATAGAKATKR